MKNAWNILAASGWMDAMMDSRYWNSILDNIKARRKERDASLK